MSCSAACCSSRTTKEGDKDPGLSFHTENMSQRRNNRSQAEEDGPDLAEPIKECVRFIVCREGSKIPIRRSEIVKHLGNVCQTPSNHINKVILGAANLLKKVYGYKLIQVDSRSGIQYILVLSEQCESLASTVTDFNHRKMLIAALTHIFMTGSAVKEEEMWKFLEEAGLLEENDHAGRKILTTTFTRQLYLSYSKVGEGDLARNVFEWGQRAIEEVPKIFLLNKMAQAFEKEPTHWCEQYKEANGHTTENAS